MSETIHFVPKVKPNPARPSVPANAERWMVANMRYYRNSENLVKIPEFVSAACFNLGIHGAPTWVTTLATKLAGKFIAGQL